MRYFIYLFCTFFLLNTLALSAQKGDKNSKYKTEKSKYKNRNAKGEKVKTSESGGKSTAFRNAYQDMTGRYNGYYNAKLILTESILKLKNNNKEDYTALLDVFPYKSGGEAGSVHNQMDVIIDKASVDIKLHPNSKWVDDCYLLIGQANFFKGEYDKTIESLQYINRVFGDRIRLSEKVARERGLRERSFPSAGGNAGVGVGGQRVDAKKAKELLQKERAEKQKEREESREETLKEREETLKEREQSKKEKEKAAKKRVKERDKEKKRRAKENKKLKGLKGDKRKEYMAEIKTRRDAYSEQLKAENEEKKLEREEEIAEKEVEREEKKEAQEAEKEAKEALAAAEEAAAKKAEEEAYKVAPPTNNKTLPVKDYKAKKGISHKPAKYESLIWLARAYLAKEQNNDALAVLQKAAAEKKMSRKQRAEIYGLFTHYYLQSGDGGQALAAIDQTINYTKGKKNKSRYYFIQAQLAMQANEYEKAIQGFQKVVKSKPDKYEMAFNAKLNIARAEIANGTFDSEDADRYFAKMLKDEKNEEYEDQIYFVMSELAIENGDMAAALDLLKESVASSEGNNEQKALTYLKIAELFYNNEDYLLSSYYYDSTAALLPQEYPDRDVIIERKDVLGELAQYINTVETEDSLQRIAAMGEKDRDKFLDDLIADIAKKAQPDEEVINEGFNSLPGGSSATTEAGGFYFYNETAKSIGFNSFKSQWGNRPLQDDWRRNTSQVGFEDLTFQNADEQTNELLALMESGQLTRDYFLNKLPLTPELVEASNQKIAYALFKAGNLYKDQLSSPDKAIIQYQDLLSRFPNHELAAQTHYTLYLLYQEKGDNQAANKHKKYILNNAPDSIYAKLLDNPEYTELAENQNLMQKTFYEETYQFYLEGNSEEVNQRVAQAKEQFADNNQHAPQYALLSAMMVGQTKERAKYIAALEGVVSGYPEDPVKEKAEEILKYLQKTRKKDAKKAVYKYEPTNSHYFVVAFDQFVESLNKTINKVADHNEINHQLEKLKVTQMLLNPQNQIILVKTFESGEEAMKYYNKFSTDEDGLLGLIGDDISVKYFAISKRNFTQYFKTKDVDTYYDFFRDNYIK